MERSKSIALLIAVVVLAATASLIINETQQPPSNVPSNKTVRTSTSSLTARKQPTNTTSEWVARELREASANAAKLSGSIYASLGYPSVTLPRDGINVTYRIALGSHEVRIGYVRLRVIGLLNAWARCVEYLRSHLSKLLPNASPEQLRRVGFSLVNAELWSGEVVNDTLVSRPSWWFDVALTWDGYRLASINGAYLDVEVDALSGNVTVYWRDAPKYVLPPPNLSLPKVSGLNISSARELVINALSRYLASRNQSEALKTIKEYLRKMSVDLVLAQLGPKGSLCNNSLVFEGLINSSFNGEWRLYILANEHDITPPTPPRRCEFLVDLESDTLVASECEQLYPPYSYFEASVYPILINAPTKEVSVWRTIKIGNESVNAPVILPNAVDLSGGGSIKLFVGWVARGSLSNSSLKRIVEIWGSKAVVSLKVVWPRGVGFRVSPEEVMLDSTVLKDYVTISWGRVKAHSMSSVWPRAIIVKATIKYVGGSTLIDYVMIPFSN